MRPYRWFSLFLLIFVLLAGCNSAPTESATQSVPNDSTAAAPNDSAAKQDRYWNDVARYLAGMTAEEGSELAELHNSKAFAEHQKTLDLAWSKKDAAFLSPLAEWKKDKITADDEKRTIFYPFSGPDFLTLYQLFPNADKYVMTALETEGGLHDPRKLPADTIARNLKHLQKSIAILMEFSFFRTLDMEKDLIKTEFNGTLPIMLAFIARTNNRVVGVKHVKVDETGQVVAFEDDGYEQKPDDGEVTGVEIKFEKDGKTKTVQYFSANIRDNLWNNKPGFIKYITGLKPTTTYIKSASYLMHRAIFAKMTDAVLDVSDVILQDDSGLPYKFFDPEIWDVKLYGRFTGTIANKEFAPFQQMDLQKIYKKDTTIEKLKFGIGYKYRVGESNLQLARRKAGK